MTTRLWKRVKLRWLAWDGPLPEPGDVLKTSTGRTYEIIESKGRTLTCRVVPPDTRIEGRLFEWRWSPRTA